MNILLNVIATNKYIDFAEPVINSTLTNFFLNSNLTIVVHTNEDLPESLVSTDRVSIIKNKIDHEPWPFTTLRRFEYFLTVRELAEQHDYCFYIDADSLFIDQLTEDLLPERGTIGTIHPCLTTGPGTPDRNPNSTAYLPYTANNRYFCGGFFGASTSEFLDMSTTISTNIKQDLENDVMAIWHDESHLNKYYYINPPNVILDAPFAIAQNIHTDYENSKILFLDKASVVENGVDYFRN